MTGQLADDCFATGGALTPLADALDLLARRTTAIAETQRVPVADAGGCVLAEDVVADRPVPPHDNAAVDGYAVAFDALDPAGDTRLPVGGRIAAGHPLGRPPRPGEALHVLTGAAMPGGAHAPDTVFMQEDVRLDNGAVVLPPGIRRGANYRFAGEDIAAGDRVAAAGARLRPQDVGLIASIGRAAVTVYRPLRVAVLSTGDEVAEPGAPLGPGGIYDANRPALIAMLGRLGLPVTDLGIRPDRRDSIEAALAEAARDHDVVLTSGGMSTGAEDHVKAAIEAGGGRLWAWRLAIKPGRPVALGRLGPGLAGRPIVGLPGNPVAVLVTFMLLARPLIARLGGEAPVPEPRRWPVRAGFACAKKTGRREFLRARLATTGTGAPVAIKVARQGAGVLSSLAEADGLVELGEGVAGVAEGDTVAFLPFAELM